MSTACERLARKLRALSPKLQSAARQVCYDAASVCADRARAAAPVDSGELRRGIVARPSADGAEVISAAGHAAAVEFGTSRMRPRPTLQGAVQAVHADFARAAEIRLREVWK